MARSEIIEKLVNFLAGHTPPSEECHVVYVMVEIRKILDHEHTREFPLLRFCCDWTVHTEKDVITPQIKEIMQEIFHTVRSGIEVPYGVRADSPMVQFAYMQKLKSEMETFLRKHGISTGWAQGDNWVRFVELLVKVLENQPIIRPTEDIVEFAFVPAAVGAVQAVVKFSQPIKGYREYKFAMAY